MKSIAFTEYGNQEKLKMMELPDPQPGPNDVIVDVKACALNHLDIWILNGLPIEISMPHVLGCESAGIVSQIGKNVNNVKPGDKVLVEPGVPCRSCPQCQDGWDSMCDQYQIMGFQRNGGYAEKLAAPSANMIPIDDSLSFEEWASIPLVFLTAWHMLATRGQLKKGETVLIHAGGSGIGSAAIQVARYMGATSIVTASTQEKLNQAKALGASYVTGYVTDEILKTVKEATNDRGVDVVFEHIGTQTWDASMKSLSKRGRLVTCGATSGPEVKIDLRFLYMKQLSISGCYMGGRKELDHVLQLVRQGVFKPIVAKTFPLDQAQEAHALMHSRDFFGKIVLKP